MIRFDDYNKDLWPINSIDEDRVMEDLDKVAGANGITFSEEDKELFFQSLKFVISGAYKQNSVDFQALLYDYSTSINGNKEYDKILYKTFGRWLKETGHWNEFQYALCRRQLR